MINIGKKGTIHFSNEETSLVLFSEDEELYFLYIGRKLGPDVETYLESLYLGKKRMGGSLLSGMCRNPFHFKVKDTRKINGLTRYSGSSYPDLIGNAETLEFTLLEDSGELEMTLDISILSDAICSKAMVRNRGKKNISISSFSPLPVWNISKVSASGKVITQSDGRFEVSSGDLFHSKDSLFTLYTGNSVLHETILSFGAKTFSFEEGKAVMSEDERYFGRILHPAESIHSPSVVITEGEREESAWEKMRRVLSQSERGNGKRMLTPIMLSTKKSLGLSVDERVIGKVIKKASSLGFEGILIDEGWFSSRKEESEGLGDWHIDTMKFPSGLKALGEEIHLQNLLFGLWIDPLTANKRSMAFEEYGKDIIGKECDEYMLWDVRKKDVVDKLFSKISSVIEIGKLDYLKLTLPGKMAHFPADENFASEIKKGTYELLVRITSAYPNLYISLDDSDPSLSLFSWIVETESEKDAFLSSSYLGGKATYRCSSTYSAFVSSVPIYECSVLGMGKSEEEILRNEISYIKEHRNLFSDGKRGFSGKCRHISSPDGKYALIAKENSALASESDLDKERAYIIRTKDDEDEHFILTTGRLISSGIKYGGHEAVVEVLGKEKRN